MLALEPNPRNAALLRLAYGAGLRIAELCALAWRDLAPRDDAGQITLFGKGGKTRVVLLPASVWCTLMPLHGEAGPDDPVFRSAKGGHLVPSAAHRVVKQAAARAGLPGAVSAHWLRHAHALACPRSRRTDPSGAGDAGSWQRRHHRPLSARPTQRQLSAVSGNLAGGRAAFSAILAGRSPTYLKLQSQRFGDRSLRGRCAESGAKQPLIPMHSSH
jgi:integrase